MKEDNKITKEIIIEFNKRFANGEQYIHITPTGEIEELPKDYYWQEREVYNKIRDIVSRVEWNRGPFPEEKIYGKNGLVDRLIPLQKSFNKIRNKRVEMIIRIASGVFAVEDGSMDIDLLQEEGIAPEAVLVYRQGSQPPTTLQIEDATDSIERLENTLIAEMYMIAEELK